jgi:hypothetical protein
MRILVALLVLLTGFAQADSKESSRQVQGLIDGSLVSERQCLTEVLWYEARGVGTAEKRLVIDVVLNRLSTPSFSAKKATKAPVDSYSSTICKIIWSSKQFSYRNSLKYGERKALPEVSSMQQADRKSFAEISKLVQKTVSTSGNSSYNLKYIKQSNLPKAARHYATKSTKNFWTRASKVVKIAASSGNKHAFYVVAN